MASQTPNGCAGNGYLAAVLGSLAGAFLLGAIGLLLGLLYVRLFMPYAELEAIIPIVAGLYAGLLAGAVGGCWLLLRYRGQANPRRTALACGAFILLGLPLIMVANTWLYTAYRIGGPVVSGPLLILLVIAAALLARRLGCRR